MMELLGSSMYSFCTYFDHRYLLQGVALYRSLEQHCPAFRLWVLCLDASSFETLTKLNLQQATLIPLRDIESHDPELLNAKQNRSLVEYYFTCTPSLPLYIFAKFPQVDMVTYLDADLCFFADPAPIYKEMASGSIAIIEHRFPEHLRHLREHGLYNVGWLSFRRDEKAMVCLRWWRARCLEWCYDRVEDGRFADQKYLDDWTDRFEGVVVLKHKGANLAPWNLANYTLRRQRKQLLVDKDPLIFYHFHALRILYPWLYDLGLDYYGVRPFPSVVRGIYQPYLRTLAEYRRSVIGVRRPESLNSRGPARTPGEADAFCGVTAMKKLKCVYHICSGLLKRKYLCLVGDHVLWP